MKPSSGNNNNPHYSLACLDESVKIAMEIIYNFRILAYRLMTRYTIQISGHAPIFSYTNHDFYFLFLLLWNPKWKKLYDRCMYRGITWINLSNDTASPALCRTCSRLENIKNSTARTKQTNLYTTCRTDTESKLWNMQKHSQLSIASQSASNNWIQV